MQLIWCCFTPAVAQLACQGTELIPAHVWEHVRNLRDVWVDVDLPESRVMLRSLNALRDVSLEQHAEDCGFGVLLLILASLRAADYDLPKGDALELFQYAQHLRDVLEPLEPAAVEAEWSIRETALDLVSYPWLLELTPPHDCAGTALKFFVYDLPRPYTAGVLHCHHGQWGTEVLFPHFFRTGTCRTTDPEQADFFIVPWHTWCERMVYNRSADSGKLPARYMELMNSSLLSHWSKRSGMDHIFIFGDQGLNYFPQWREYLPDSILLLTEALTPACGPSCYQPWKDVLIPGHVDFFRWRRMRSYNLPSEERQLLLNFHGRYPGIDERLGGKLYENNTVRGAIMESFSDRHDCSVGGFTDGYFEIMGASHFCLVPMGTSSWTNHLYEAFFAGCIPVILSDNFGIPFRDAIPWQDISVKWPMHKVAEGLYEHLAQMSLEKIKRMKAGVDEHACAFDFHRQLSQDCSPYHYVIRELERKRVLLGTEWTPKYWNIPLSE